VTYFRLSLQSATHGTRKVNTSEAVGRFPSEPPDLPDERPSPGGVSGLAVGSIVYNAYLGV
jgi:hypothetical protein